MKINFLTTVILLTPTLFVASFCHAQERSADSNPSQNLDHPAQYADPSIVPFEGEVVPSDLSSGSRQIQGKQQRVVGSIVQLPNGELKFVLRPEIAGGMGPLNNNSRGGGRVAEAESSDKLPSSESGAYSKPEGFGSDKTESVAEEGAKNESDLSGVSSPDKFSKAELLKIEEETPVPFGHVFQMADGTVYTTEEEKSETPTELAAGSRAPVQETGLKDVGAHVNGTYDAVGDRVVFIATEWRGGFSGTIANRVFKKAIGERIRKGNSAAEVTQAKKMGARADGHQTRKLAPDRHMVIGWYNIDRKRHKWYAIKITSATTFRYLTSGGISNLVLQIIS